MATPQRDEGLDKLEAFIALLDAARDRIEHGAERLETAAGDLRESAEDLAQEEQRLEQMLAEQFPDADVQSVASDIAELGAESASGTHAAKANEDSLAERVEALLSLAEASIVFLLDAAAEALAEDSRKHLELLAESLVQLREQQAALMRELQQELTATREEEEAAAEKLKESSVLLSVAMIAVAVCVVVIAIVVAVLASGAASSMWSLVLIAVVAAIVMLCLTIVQSVPTLLEGIATLMKYCGFPEAGKALEGAAAALEVALEQDWFKWTVFAILIAAALASLVAGLGAAAAVAAVVTAMAAVLTIAMAVVENVARLLSALNPFD
jgi:hypothetical protein